MTPLVELDSPDFPPFSETPLSPRARGSALFYDVDVLVDVGANGGQHTAWARECGFDGRGISFEPAPEPFRALAEAARPDDRWECHNLALGPEDGEIDLHVSRSSLGTSVFEPNDSHAHAWPSDVVEDVVRVPMRSLWPELGRDQLLLVSVYHNAPVFADVLPFLAERGFSVVASEQNGGDDDQTGQMLMIDGIFRRTPEGS
ncbi:FkbM family methyltransferase [Kutzneria sp. CA-103260]|uniref:FkbM family methyltransferase n=1 Tax=Kutzneria sp. CA-103260 TaxID=2802641 RepID=UPI001BACD134|nr:FkbM family methyltransferase [Kutzneria sp. CA-103260]QUQ67487.1 Methyltransferase FkbM domain protein [Kutzneria sp. CA-103260]